MDQLRHYLEDPCKSTHQAAKRSATDADITSIFWGNLNFEKLLAILSFAPRRIAEVEEKAIRLSGDADVFGANEPVKGNASHIITILTAEEEEEP